MPPLAEALGVIYPHALYTLDALKRTLGLKDAALRTARRAGLPVYYCHGRAFVIGEDWIGYVKSSSRTGRQPAGIHAGT